MTWVKLAFGKEKLMECWFWEFHMESERILLSFELSLMNENEIFQEKANVSQNVGAASEWIRWKWALPQIQYPDEWRKSLKLS